MNKKVRMILSLAICAVFIVIIISSCTEQRQSNPRQNRLTIAELRQQVARNDKIIKDLRGQIEKCREENVALKRETEQQMDSLGEEAMKMFEDNLKLQEENENLKKQIEELKNQ